MTLINEQTIASRVQVFAPDTFEVELRAYVAKLETENRRKDELNRILARDNDRMRAAIEITVEELNRLAGRPER
ncbi:MAG: hypothetical protein H0W99_13945 [Acidobacteria bacterium]|nr:hypothetical protein [Acidobacteriota bacterium]